MTQTIKIKSLPGIKRDGTRFESQNYVDGNWCRFQRGKPKKMAGFTSVSSAVAERTRGMHSFSNDGIHHLHLGSETGLFQFNVNNSGNLALRTDRTPSALVNSVDNLWQFSAFWDLVTGDTRLVAHTAPNLMDIASEAEGIIFHGDITATAILSDVAVGMADVSGGIVSLAPYLFSYGNEGTVTWSVLNDFSGVGTLARITGQKIVKGMPLRGSGTGPAGLFWSLDSLVRATFADTAVIFRFDHLSSQISVLSSQGIIEYDGIYFWAGVDRFLMFNGVVREVPNQMNLNWFYENLNFDQRQKVFAYKVPRYGEIWWCYPRGSATECTHAVIYNLIEQTWYDTELPDEGRIAGVYASVYNKPFMVDNFNTATPGYTLWQHETGTDKVDGPTVKAIASHFETSEISMIESEQSSDKSLRVGRVEPDFVQSGDMTLKVTGRANPKAPSIESSPKTFPAIATNGDEETVKLKDVRRLMSFRFDSNVSGGTYEMGEPIAHVDPTDGRIES